MGYYDDSWWSIMWDSPNEPTMGDGHFLLSRIQGHDSGTWGHHFVHGEGKTGS